MGRFNVNIQHPYQQSLNTKAMQGLKPAKPRKPLSRCHQDLTPATPYPHLFLNRFITQNYLSHLSYHQQPNNLTSLPNQQPNKLTK